MISSDKILFFILTFFILAGLAGGTFFRKSLRNANLFLTSLVAIAAMLLSFFYINQHSGAVVLAYDMGMDIGFFTYDPISLVLFAVITIFYVLFLVFRSFVVVDSPRFLLEITGTVFSVVGIWLAIFSSTAWALMGSLALLGIAALFQDRGSMLSHSGSSAILKLFFLRFAAWMSMLGGVIVIASVGGLTSWADKMIVPVFSASLIIGIMLFFAGAVMGIQSFPAHPIESEETNDRSAFHSDWSGYWFPVTAIIILAIRMYPLYSSSQIKIPLLLILVMSAVFSFISALLQPSVEKTSSRIRSGALAFILAVLLDQGPLEGLVLFMATFIGSMLFQFVGSNGSKLSSHVRAGLKVLMAFLILGGPGVVSSLPLVSWFSTSTDQAPVFFALKSVAYFLFSVSVWKSLFMKNDFVVQGKSVAEVTVISAFSIGMASSILWSGDWILLGGLGIGVKSDVWSGLFSLLGAQNLVVGEKDILTALLIQTGVFWTSAAVSFWLVVKKPGSMAIASVSWPKTVRFIQNGYGVGESLNRISIQLREFSVLDRHYLHEWFWKQKLPRFFERVMIASSKFISGVDEIAQSAMRRSVTKGISSFTRVSQLMQSGDLQWYLIIGLIAALVMILNILRG